MMDKNKFDTFLGYAEENGKCRADDTDAQGWMIANATMALAIAAGSIAESLEKLARCTTKDDAISTFVGNK